VVHAQEADVSLSASPPSLFFSFSLSLALSLSLSLLLLLSLSLPLPLPLSHSQVADVAEQITTLTSCRVFKESYKILSDWEDWDGSGSGSDSDWDEELESEWSESSTDDEGSESEGEESDSRSGGQGGPPVTIYPQKKAGGDSEKEKVEESRSVGRQVPLGSQKIGSGEPRTLR
jgi:hypothetical protein